MSLRRRLFVTAPLSAQMLLGSGNDSNKIGPFAMPVEIFWSHCRADTYTDFLELEKEVGGHGMQVGYSIFASQVQLRRLSA